jgi:ribosomal protein S12 methylthiotransferase accessory factor
VTLALACDLTALEPSARACFEAFRPLIDPCTGIVLSLERDSAECEDEPVFPAVRARLAPTAGLSDGGYEHPVAVGGRALDVEDAAVAAIFEAIERYCLSIYRFDRLERASFAEHSAAGRMAVDPASLVSRRQPPARSPSALRQAQLWWTAGWSLHSAAPIMVPAQLVYVPYRWGEDEVVLRDPITTGAAAGLSRGRAVLRGLLEVVERDAAMLTHYRRLGGRRLLPERHTTLAETVDTIASFRLDTRLYDCTVDLPVPVVVATVIDDTGVGPAVTVGSKASLDAAHAAIGAVLEAVCFRHPMRARMATARRVAARIGEQFDELDRADQRAYRWVQADMVRHLAYLDTGGAAAGWPSASDPVGLLEAVLALPADVIVCDVTTPEIAELGVTVVKVVVPELQPMHLSESLRCWTSRLCSFQGNRQGAWDPDRLVPHPFL